MHVQSVWKANVYQELLTKADSDKQGQTLSLLAIEILNFEQNFHYSYHICRIK